MTGNHPTARKRNSGKPSGLSSKRITQPARTCRAPKPGQRCPKCRNGKLDYDGLLNLVCPTCGYCAPGAGGFT